MVCSLMNYFINMKISNFIQNQGGENKNKIPLNFLLVGKKKVSLDGDVQMEKFVHCW